LPDKAFYCLNGIHSTIGFKGLKGAIFCDKGLTGNIQLEIKSEVSELQRRGNLLYVEIDLHKENYTTVMVNCENKKLKVVVIQNKPMEVKQFSETRDIPNCIK